MMHRSMDHLLASEAAGQDDGTIGPADSTQMEERTLEDAFLHLCETVDQGGPEQDQGGPEQDQGGPEQDQGGPEQDQDGLEQDQDGPEQDQGGPEQDQGGPEQDQGGPEQDQGGPEQDQGGPEQDQDGLEQDQDGPEQDQGGPEQDQGGPEQDQDGPEQDQGDPEQDQGFSVDWKVRARHLLPKGRHITALMIKTMLQMKRNPRLLCFLFLLPVVQISLICLCLGGYPTGIQVAVVNNDTSTPSYSQFILSFLDNAGVHQVPLSHHDAFNGIKNGEYWAVIGFGKDFTSFLTQRMNQQQVSEEVVDGGSMHIWMDQTNQPIAVMLEHMFRSALWALGKNVMESPWDLANLPIKFEEPIYGSGITDFSSFVAPGAVLSIIFYLAMGLTALSFILERKKGLWERCLVTGATSMEMILAQIVIQLFVISVQITLLLFVFLVFKIPNEGSLVLVITLMVLQGITGISFGLVIFASVNNVQTANQIVLSVFFPVLVLSGIIWPVESIPYPLRYLSLVLPQTYATEALRSIMYRGWGLSQMVVWRGFAVTLGWSAFFFILAAVIMKMRA